MIRVPPFNAVVFTATDEGERARKWAPLIDRISSAVSKAEFLMIGEKGRKCNTVLVPPGRTEIITRIVKEYGLVFKEIARVRYYQGYSHYHEEPRGPEEAAIFGVACIDEESAEMFRRAYHARDHYTQGKLLGYPECDIKAFIRYWGMGYFSPEPLIAMNTKDCNAFYCRIDPLLNTALRFVGVRAIPFFPHSYDCKAAKKWAEKFIEKIRKVDKMAYKALLELLSEPIEFTQVNALIEVRVGDPPWMKILTQGFSSEEISIMLIPKYNALEKYG